MANPQQGLDIVAHDFASAVIQKVNGNVQNFTQTAKKAGSASSVEFTGGLRKASNAVNNLAGDLLGVNTRVARLAEGLLEFAGGGAVVTAVAAGITIVAAAFLYFTKEAREAKKAYDDYMDSLRKPTPLAIIGRELDAETAKLAEMRELQQRFGGAGPKPEEIAAQQARIAVLQAQYDALFRNTRTEAAKAGAKVGEQLAEEAVKAFEATIDRRGQRLGALFQDKIQITKELPKGPTIRTDESAFGGPVPATLEPPDFKPAADAALSFRDALGLIAETAGPVAEAMNAINDSVLGSIPGFGQVAKAAQKAVQIVAKVEGAIAIAKGAVKVAESIWPFNPAGLKSGLGMIAEGTKLSALGGGGGSSSASGGGAGSGGSYASRQEQIARDQGKVTVVVPKDAVWSTNSTEFQDFLAQTLRNLGGRRLEIAYS